MNEQTVGTYVNENQETLFCMLYTYTIADIQNCCEYDLYCQTDTFHNVTRRVVPKVFGITIKWYQVYRMDMTFF